MNNEEVPLLGHRPMGRAGARENRSGEFRGARGVGAFLNRFYKFHSSHIVLAVVFFERAALYGITVNLVQFLEYRSLLQWSTTSATIAVLMCLNLAYMGACVTGFLADTRLGRLNVLLAGQVLFCAAALCLMIASFLEYCSSVSQHVYVVFIVLGLLFIGLGTAFAMGSEIPLGLDQYALQMEQYSTARGFFPVYYFILNLGAFLAMGFISFVQYNFLFGIGFAIPAAMALISASLLFCCRKRLHTAAPDRESPLFNVVKIVREARRVRKVLERSAEVSWWGRTSAEMEPTAHWVQFATTAHGGCYSHNEAAYVQNVIAVISVIASTIFYQITILQVSITIMAVFSMRVPF